MLPITGQFRAQDESVREKEKTRQDFLREFFLWILLLSRFRRRGREMPAAFHPHRQRNGVRFPSPSVGCSASKLNVFRRHLPSAEKSPERIKQAAGKIERFLRTVRCHLCKRPLRTTVHLAGNSWYLVHGQLDVVSGTG